MNKDKLIPVGSLVKHHGLKGELKVFLYNEDSETLVKGLSIWIETDNDFISYDLENVRGSKNNLIIKFKNINSRDKSQFLVKKEIYVSRNDFPDLDEGFYLNDIIGFKIINDNKQVYGYLKDVLVLTGNEILVVDCDGKEVLVPNVEEFVKLFDFDKKLITVSNFEQFFEKK